MLVLGGDEPPSQAQVSLDLLAKWNDPPPHAFPGA